MSCIIYITSKLNSEKDLVQAYFLHLTGYTRINTFYVNPLRLTLFSNSPYGIGIRRSRLDPYFF